VSFIDRLTEPIESVPVKVANVSGGVEAARASNGLRISGAGDGGRASIALVPAEGEAWDFSVYSYLRVRLTNAAKHLVWVQGRLDNRGAEDWANSTASQVFIQPGETVTLGFAYPRRWELDDGPAIFSEMSARPNGFRAHWKSFDPSRVTRLMLRVQSAAGPIDLRGVELSLGYRFGKEANADDIVLPYLDRFGQPIPFDWLGKAASLADLERAWSADEAALEAMPAIADRTAFGGWATGPELEATGFFRVQKHAGKWWLVDPTGRLFWSHGMNSVNIGMGTPIKNREALFSWLPDEDDPLHGAAMAERKGEVRIDFLSANQARRFGEDWQARSRDLIHRRFAKWGMNTLGAWSDSGLADAQQTPYTAITHTWHPPREMIDKVADPFAERFATRLRDQIASSNGERKDDPWCVGVFIDNEIHWPGKLVELVFASRADQPAKVAFVAYLREQYQTIAALNEAWSSGFASWDALRRAEGLGDAKVPSADWEALYGLYADRYYGECKAALSEVMPNHLYLGSRVHSCPRVVSVRSAAHVDVYSTNYYWALAGTGGLPAEVDRPVMISEYHFGTMDRGVLGTSLYAVHGQTQRARAYAAYTAAGLLNDRIVGAHWFAYSDQCAVGQAWENYQIGFVDITDLPYDEIIAASRVIGERMYELRSDPDADLLGWLEEHLPREE
jgi:hypothetical protein